LLLGLTKRGVAEKNGDGFSLLREIEATQLKEERFEGEKLNLVELKRGLRGRKVKGLREEEEEDRSLSMASIVVDRVCLRNEMKVSKKEQERKG